jgi:hypothetical protein
MVGELVVRMQREVEMEVKRESKRVRDEVQQGE